VPELLGHAHVTAAERHLHMETDDLCPQVADMPANQFRL